jgi:hypothetical protein
MMIGALGNIADLIAAIPISAGRSPGAPNPSEGDPTAAAIVADLLKNDLRSMCTVSADKWGECHFLPE